MTVQLSELEIGKRAKIIDIAKSDFRKSLLEMGFLPGTVIERLRSAPLADPVEFKLRGYSISLRRADAENITVEVIN